MSVPMPASTARTSSAMRRSRASRRPCSIRLGGYCALPEKDIFDVEYWDLEQAKLRKAGKPPVFTGEVALVTGAASGIGQACVAAFRKRGAAVVSLDVNPDIERAN